MRETFVEVVGGKLRLRPNPNAPGQQGKKALKQLDSSINELERDWDNLPAAQRLEVLRQALIAHGRILQWLARR